MRPIWKGSISFSLITIPIALYPASRREEVSFRLLRSSDLSPVNYKRVAETDGKEVPWDKIVKGYEYEKGKFVVLKDEDFRRVDVEATQTIDIIDFVKLEEINPIFFDKPYFLVPQKAGTKAYALLRDALRKTGRVGIAKVVIKSRQHLAAIKPQNNALVLELMHFADELIKPGNLNIPASLDVGTRELEMATDLVERMTDAWDPEKYTDDYRSALMNLIQKKVEHGGKTPPEGPTQKKKKPSNVIDLVSVLQESLDQSHAAAHTGKTTKSPSRKHKTKKAA
ncbi:Ku protein [Pedosphaera parvula]|uniref:Non-homologous end joining protein Ku n=1 Tax=Pedosphaera parvula (strain Ellin514) TaxID=320771 RepID=B9XGI1_PEDPL|nr:Ku protein [Pedosphaera parvula]EEF61032.1 Ku protein [Pedosphaera parvula Ellin514]